MAENESGNVTDTPTREYRVTKAQPTTFFDSSGQPVNGYRITVELTFLKETHFFDVADLKPETVKPVIRDFIKDRKALDEL